MDDEAFNDEEDQANVKFHYVVNPDGKLYWFPTEAKAREWVTTHKLERGKYAHAHGWDDARRIVLGGVRAVPTRGRKPRSDKGVKRGPRKQENDAKLAS